MVIRRFEVSWITRLWNRRQNPAKTRMISFARTVSFEGLEHRTLMSVAPHIVKALADNRGKVELTVDAPLNSAIITDNAVAIFTAGADGQFNTADDVHQTATVRYRAGTN